MTKLSFLIAAHNEEKIIANALNNLIKLPYKNYEIIIGLDGCTDNTEEVIKKFQKNSKKIKYYKLSLRKGKPAVINSIIKKASGDIVVIHDADWIFKFNNKKILQEFLSVFNKKEVGGIAESFPVEWDFQKLKKGNLGYKMVAHSSYFWFEFQKKRFAGKQGNLIYLREPAMFLTNIFRKKLYKENASLGDDFERTYDIMGSKYKIVIFDSLNYPRMISSYGDISIKDLFKQKVRTAVARKQLKKSRNWKINSKTFYIPIFIYMFKESLKKGLNVFFIISFWIFLSFLATIYASLKQINTREGWSLRAR